LISLSEWDIILARIHQAIDPIVKPKKRLIKEATMMDVAEQAGVSISSVSRVTNYYSGVHPTLRSRVERVIQELDYPLSIAFKKRSPKLARLSGLGQFCRKATERENFFRCVAELE
jgi:AraC-like DNA-binding protein